MMSCAWSAPKIGSRPAHAFERSWGGGRTDVKVVHGDITKPRCGLGASDCQLLFGRINRVVHCAASLNFQDKEETNLTNVTGLQHVLELMDLLDTQHVVYISTAYVVGDAPYLSEERPPDGQRWNNCYEESKFVGEGMVRAWALSVHPGTS
jgi:thioester reductase-like protein